MAQTGPIVKPLPPEWFVPLGTNAEMRWDAAAELGYRIANERFFVRNHTATPAIDVTNWRLSVFGRRGCASVGRAAGLCPVVRLGGLPKNRRR